MARPLAPIAVTEVLLVVSLIIGVVISQLGIKFLENKIDFFLLVDNLPFDGVGGLVDRKDRLGQREPTERVDECISRNGQIRNSARMNAELVGA